MTESPEREPSGAPSLDYSGEVSTPWILGILLRERRFILAFIGVGIFFGTALALLRPTTYTSTFSFLPQAPQDPSRAGLASLAGQFGISLAALGGPAQPPQFYADLLSTREVLGPIAIDSVPIGPDTTTRVPLATLLDVGGHDPAIILEKSLRVLRKDVISSTVAIRNTGMVTVSVRTESPYASLAIARRLLEGLHHFNLITRQSQAREERRFTEGRLAEARDSLRSAEDALQRFLQANRQFAESSALTFQRDRLQREVLLQQQVVTSLAQQYEQNRIQEVRDTPVITVIDKPNLAARPDPRLRGLILLLGVLAGMSVGFLIVVWRDGWRRGRSEGTDPGLALLAGEWKRMRGGTGA
jgi:uncharacterized protein involved in exopolysaccharide biosynthesis